jgi:ornithine cyclodeaminase
VRYLSAADLDRALPMSAALDAMRAVFADAANGVVPERVFMRQPRPGHEVDAWLGAMPAGWTGHGFGAKVVSLIEDNPGAGRPAIQGLAVLLDAATGAPALITDAAVLTTRRTAAMAGVATDLLAAPDASRMALIGTGALASDMVAAMRAVRPIEKVSIFNRTRARAEAFAATLDIEASVGESAAAAVADADIVTLCTTSKEPVVADADLPAGVHINAVGNFSPAGSELELATVARSAIWVDSYHGAFAEAGEIVLAIEQGLLPPGREGLRGELADLVATAGVPPRDPNMPTLYKSVGTALADVGAMVVAREIAARDGFGTELG